MYIYQREDWPEFWWDKHEIGAVLPDARYLQGRLLGRMQSLGFDLQEHARH